MKRSAVDASYGRLSSLDCLETYTLERNKEARKASSTTCTTGPLLGRPCGVGVDGLALVVNNGVHTSTCTLLVYVNFTSDDEKCIATDGTDGAYFSLTSHMLANAAMHELFQRCPANTRLRCACAWLAFRCDLTSARVTGMLERLAMDMSHRTSAAALWSLAAPKPMQLYVSSHALLGAPMRYTKASALARYVNASSMVFDWDMAVCLSGDGVDAFMPMYVHTDVASRFERDKYPSPFLTQYTLHPKAQRGRMGRPRPIDGRSACMEDGPLPAAADDSETVIALSMDRLLPALHHAWRTLVTEADFRCVLALFSAATDTTRAAGMRFQYRNPSRGDGLEAMLLRYLPASYVKPKLFTGPEYTAALARPTAVLWWWLLKTMEETVTNDVLTSSTMKALLGTTALLFELSSNAMRVVEHVLLWSAFGSLVALSVPTHSLSAWLQLDAVDGLGHGLGYGVGTGTMVDVDAAPAGSDDVDTVTDTVTHTVTAIAATGRTGSVPWLHGLRMSSKATRCYSALHAQIEALPVHKTAAITEVAAIQRCCSLTDQLQTRAMADVSEVMTHQRSLAL